MRKAELDFTTASEVSEWTQYIITYSGRWPEFGRPHSLQAQIDLKALGKFGLYKVVFLFFSFGQNLIIIQPSGQSRELLSSLQELHLSTRLKAFCSSSYAYPHSHEIRNICSAKFGVVFMLTCPTNYKPINYRCGC